LRAPPAFMASALNVERLLLHEQDYVESNLSGGRRFVASVEQTWLW
jgi:hypothetical protein